MNAAIRDQEFSAVIARGAEGDAILIVMVDGDLAPG
jgi:hypothetical protein